MSELQDFLTTDPAFDYSTFSIDSLSRASWAIRKLSLAQKRINEIQAEAQAEIDKVNEWVESATKSARQDKEFFENSLKAYMIRLREEEGEKSLSLPDGEISSRSVPAKARVSDLGVFLKWAEETGHRQWVRVKKEADLTALHKHVRFEGDAVLDSETGEVIEGLLAIDADVSVTVTPIV